MATLKNIHNPEAVTAHLQALEPQFMELVQAIRNIILNVDDLIGEQIKWNSPSFFYTGAMMPFDPKEYKRDIVVLNLHKGKALLVFPTGAKISDATGLLQGNYTDGRRIVPIADMADLETKKQALQSVIKQWLSMVV